jgi:uncharacterized protein (DUF58 family)
MGFLFLGILIVLWTLGTNYQNNLILGLSLLLASLFVLAILRTHENLSGLDVEFIDAEPGFAGQEAAFQFDLVNASRRPRDALCLTWQNELPAWGFVDAESRQRVPVPARAVKRGFLQPGRLCIETVYPLGLLRCWTWLQMDARAVVFPPPENLRELLPQSVQDESGGEASPIVTRGADEFAGLREYRAGDSLKHIAWKQFARDQGLLSKSYSSELSTEAWLTWESTAGLTVEQRLSVLCYWVLHYDQLGGVYGLSMPGRRIEPGSGPEHKHEVLTALALYEEGASA